MNIYEIYNSLCVGERLQLRFGGEKECETFRVRLYQVKKLQDKIAIDLGIFKKDDRPVLGFEIQGELEGTVLATFYFKDRKEQKQYEVIVLKKEEPQNE